MTSLDEPVAVGRTTTAALLASAGGAEAGRVIRGGSAEPIMLDDPGTVWVVDSGEVDVFVRSSPDGRPSGPRTHLFRAGAGEVLLGLEQTDGLQVLAVGLADATVRELDRDRFTAWVDAHPDEAEPLLDGWIGHLTTSAATGAEPREPVLLAPDQEVSDRDGKPVQSAVGVVWVSHPDADLLFAGDPDLRVASGQLWPLCDPAWVVGSGTDPLRGQSTASVLRAREWWPALAAFQRLVLQALERSLRQQAAAAWDRLLVRADTDRRMQRSAASRLASVLDDTGVRPVAAQPTEDPTLAACQVVGRFLGIDVRPPERLEEGVTHTVLEQISRTSRIRMRRVTLTAGWWRRDGGPLLGFRDGRPVALLPKGPRAYELVDPSAETRTRVSDDLAAEVEPRAYVLYPPLPERAVGVRDLLRFILRGNGRDLTTVLAMGVAGGLLGMIVPLATKQVVETAIPQAEANLLVVLAFGMVAATVSGMLFEIVRSFAVLRIETKVDSTFQAAVWDRLLSLPATFFRRYSSGDLAVRALGINAIRQIITGATVSTLLSGLFSIFSFGLIFYFSARLGALALLMGLVVVGVTLGGSYLQLRYQRQTTEVMGRITSLVLQLVGGVAKLRVAGAETRAFAVWADQFATQKVLSSKAQSASNLLTVFNASSGIITSMVIFGVVGFTSRGDMSTGDFVAFNTAFAQFLFASTGITSAFTSILQAAPYYERAKPILQTTPEVDRGKIDPGELAGGIELKGVTFRYDPDGPVILDQVSIEADPGQFVAIVGPSGAGKSSLLRLLLGFETPESGSIYYDARDLSGLDLTAVRRQMGVVLQNGRLMTGNIFSNIVGSAALTMDDAWRAARMSGLDADISAMPMGMYTFLSEGATTISGGQRQRLMIARAIVDRPRILLFDEATSALDNHTQALVTQSLDSLNVTRIVIAHRLSTIINADRIYVLDGGRIVQSGTYAELMEREGPFRELALRQLA